MIKSEKIELDEHGINLMRNGIRSEYLEYSQVKYAEINKEFRIRYWIISLIIGILILIISVIEIKDIFLNFEYNPEHYDGDIRIPWMMLISMIIIGIMSIGIILSSLKRTMILYIFIDKGYRRISLMDLEKKKLINELYSFLEDRIELRLEKE